MFYYMSGDPLYHTTSVHPSLARLFFCRNIFNVESYHHTRFDYALLINVNTYIRTYIHNMASVES